MLGKAADVAEIDAGGGMLHQHRLAANGGCVAFPSEISMKPFDVKGKSKVHFLARDAVLSARVDDIQSQLQACVITIIR